MDPIIDAAIAKLWPAAWARANDPRLRNRSKARQQIRKRYRDHVAYVEFRKSFPTAACKNCANRSEPHLMPGKLACDLDSDFHGYQLVDSENVCTRWRADHRIDADG